MGRRSKEPTIPVYFRVSKVDYERLQGYADADKRPLSNYLRRVIENHIGDMETVKTGKYQ